MQYEDAESSPGTIGADKGSMVRAARCLLAAVTQVLLLADNVVVKQLLLAKDKVRPLLALTVALVNHRPPCRGPTSAQASGKNARPTCCCQLKYSLHLPVRFIQLISVCQSGDGWKRS